MVQEPDRQNLIEDKLKWFQDTMMVWGKQNLRVFPWRQTQDPYAILIAEFLLQQTDASRVLPIYQQLLTQYPTLRALAYAPTNEIIDILKPLGLHYRASRLQQIAYGIVKDPNGSGSIPNNETELLKFIGIGKYIARAICASAFGQSTAVLDTNVSRILQRFFGLSPRRKRARDDSYLWKAAQEIAPSTNVSVWNLTLIDFGAAICTHSHPKCNRCPIKERCQYFQVLQTKSLEPQTIPTRIQRTQQSVHSEKQKNAFTNRSIFDVR